MMMMMKSRQVMTLSADISGTVLQQHEGCSFKATGAEAYCKICLYSMTEKRGTTFNQYTFHSDKQFLILYCEEQFILLITLTR